MSSLTESTLAMPMGNPGQRTRDRLSTRRSIQHVLERSERSFLDALAMASNTGRVEDVRTACLSLALLRAFQTSLGEGSTALTASAAAILASAPAITLHREILEAIDGKLTDEPSDELKWPVVSSLARVSPKKLKSSMTSPTKPSSKGNNPGPLISSTTTHDETPDSPLRSYWESLRTKYSSNVLLQSHDISTLPPDWVVISINVTEDRNTMFISRHQANQEPLVFTLPLDRQGKREGEADEDLFTFEAAVNQLQDIISQSDQGARKQRTSARLKAGLHGGASVSSLTSECRSWWQVSSSVGSVHSRLVQLQGEAGHQLMSDYLEPESRPGTSSAGVFPLATGTHLLISHLWL